MLTYETSTLLGQRLEREYGRQMVDWKVLPDNSLAMRVRLMFTTAICLGVGEISPYTTRWCYEDMEACQKAWDSLQSEDDEPTGWVAKRPA